MMCGEKDRCCELYGFNSLVSQGSGIRVLTGLIEPCYTEFDCWDDVILSSLDKYWDYIVPISVNEEYSTSFKTETSGDRIEFTFAV